MDLLRFLAALAVVLFHFTGFGGAGPWPDPARELFPALAPVTRYGYLGVDLFFVISGFVILMSVWGRGPGEFGISRVVRLMPAYWVGVLFGGIVYAVFKLGNGVPGLVIPNLTMLQGGLGEKNVDPVYWTLWVELHFYFLIGILAVAGITYRNCLVFMTVWMLGGVFADEAGSKLLQVMLVPTWSPYFIAGMALFLMHKFGQTLLLWGYVAASWLLAMYWSSWRTGHVFKGADETVVSVVVTVIFAVMYLVATGRLKHLRWHRLTVLGALTYPLYLTHSTIALPLLENLYPELDRWTALAVVIAASLALAYAIQRLVERPGQKWMRRKLYESLKPLEETPPARLDPRERIVPPPAPAERPQPVGVASDGPPVPQPYRP
ncbi:acyltransferase family protein [Spirillospora sp. CA-294931]|uniref:acyltransferase family protein n=1 Tax=Spirillospora sp. CA-294931 TaxID=3240042 RepID=UPI003D915E2F